MRSDPLLVASAALLAAAGLPLLFAPQEISAALGGQGSAVPVLLLGPALLGLAAANWFSRATRVGGIYGRPLLLANLMFFFPGTLAVLRHASRDSGGVPGWIAGGILALFAALFGRRLFSPPPE